MKTAMILAAGRGERLRPLTDAIPKALSLIHDKPVIEYHLEKLAQAGFSRVVINHAYLGSLIRRRLGSGGKWGLEILYSPEPPGGLETGGGIYQALPLIDAQAFVTINADIYTDYDFCHFSLEKEAYLKLILTPPPKAALGGDFGLKGHELTNDKKYTFTGIAYYRREIFKDCTPGRYSVTALLRDVVQKGQARGELFQGTWLDIGNPINLKQANAIASVQSC